MKRISRILSKLEPEAAASVARRVADSYGADMASEGPDDPEPPKIEPQQSEDDSHKPSFMLTQHRMTIGKQILERERTSNK
jgi:hypothetical protein